MGGHLQSYTVVVLSDEDFRAHLDGNELIDENDYLEWRQDHHECAFTATPNSNLDKQMREVNTNAHARSLTIIRRSKNTSNPIITTTQSTQKTA
jgi:hypothetical protein